MYLNANEIIANPFASIVPNVGCFRCLDTAIWLTPTNQVVECPYYVKSDNHSAQNPAAFIMAKTARRLHKRNERINPIAFDLARILTQFSTDAPCPRLDLLEFFFADTVLSGSRRVRKIYQLIEELRQHWLLPVGSRKDRPSGYWIITDLEDFKAWFDRAKAAPITQFSTIHKVAKHNFPVFAEQMELEFFTDVEAAQ